MRVGEWKKGVVGRSVAGLSVSSTHGVLLLTGAGEEWVEMKQATGDHHHNHNERNYIILYYYEGRSGLKKREEERERDKKNVRHWAVE